MENQIIEVDIDKRLQFLILDDDVDAAEHIEMELLGYLKSTDRVTKDRIKTFNRATECLEYIKTADRIHVAVLDKNLDGQQVGEFIVPELEKRFCPMIMLIMTAFPDEEEEIDLSNMGVKETVYKGGEGDDLTPIFPKLLKLISKYQALVLVSDFIQT